MQDKCYIHRSFSTDPCVRNQVRSVWLFPLGHVTRTSSDSWPQSEYARLTGTYFFWNSLCNSESHHVNDWSHKWLGDQLRISGTCFIMRIHRNYTDHQTIWKRQAKLNTRESSAELHPACSTMPSENTRVWLCPRDRAQTCFKVLLLCWQNLSPQKSTVWTVPWHVPKNPPKRD